MDINWKKNGESEELITRIQTGVPYLSFSALEKTGMVKQGFSTRYGGVSTGCYSSMNLSYSRKDKPEHVLENYRRMAKALEVDMEKMVVSWQTHTTNVRLVTEKDLGKGVLRERDYRDVDGLITNIPGITLVTFYADCVPLYILDPVHKAIGLSHSGWRGTVNRMGEKTLKEMNLAFGTNPQDVTVCIGPSICKDCFEVGEEVAEEFRQAFSSPCWPELFEPGRKDGKYQLDLWRANQIVFAEAGVDPARIHTTNICTKCNPKHLFSHRAMGENRGNLAAFFCLCD
ncbi:MAG: peptidoglycan editing factor PgeF [Lachnospiraceae bacterium]|nr:peptidoglycan editing factor PgeF [Lachnospiraceae bacterium]